MSLKRKTQTSDLVSRVGETTYVVIPLAPVPASRPRVGRYGTFYPKAYASWKSEAEGLLSEYKLDDPVTGPVQVVMDIVCKSPANPSNPYPRGDIDNYAKAALDAVTKSGACWKDDAQIVAIHLVKRYAKKSEEPRTQMAIYPSQKKESRK